MGDSIHILVSDVGLNGYVVHGAYTEPPPPEVVTAAERFASSFTGYQNTAVELIEMNTGLPCGSCTRQTAWAECWCYSNGPAIVDAARRAMGRLPAPKAAQ